MRSSIDTQLETLPTAPAPGPGTTSRRPAPRQRWWAVPLAVAGLLVVGAVGLAGMLPASLVADKEVPEVTEPAVDDVATPYARVPATAQPVSDRISLGELDGVAERDTERAGEIYFVTVSEPSQSVLSWFVGRNEPEIDFLTEIEKFGVQSPSERRAISLEMMRTSEQVAEYVALEKLGYDVSIDFGDVVVSELVCLAASDLGCVTNAPADRVLDPGDRLLAVNGAPIGTVEDLVAELDGKQPGDTIELRIERAEDGERTVEVELISSPSDPERTIIGFVPFDTASVDLPFDVDIDTGAIGGPSAGLAFTLTLIDELSDGDLMGGRRVAVTGTIDLDGNVGAIGGMPQKASAVRQTGVDVFIVPSRQSEAELARSRAIAGDHVEIIPVATLDEALAALVDLGGDPIS